MEGDNVFNGPGGSRWNPTKEQINLLESLYMQGLRTPSAEQIQQITNRLKAFGHMEGKNVFYWIQNHKARQRQKQKQDIIASFNRFLPKNPVFPPYFNVVPVVCSPCFRQPPPLVADLELYQQCSKKPLHGGFKRRLIPENNDKNNHPACQKYNRFMHPRSINQELEYHCTSLVQRTILKKHWTYFPFTQLGGNCGQNFFGFFSGNGTCERTEFQDFSGTDIVLWSGNRVELILIED